jgi:hypothetical protein
VAACEVVIPPETATPNPFSGPTVEASPTLFPIPPTNVSVDEEFYAGVSDPTAAALAPGAALPPLVMGTPAPRDSGQAVQITALDGSLLVGLLYQTLDQVRLPGVLLLGPEEADWDDFPSRLYLAGFTVLVMPLREPEPLLDFPAMIQSLSSGLADPAALAVIGTERGADIALLGCAGDTLCDTVVLLSPSDDPALVNAMNAFNPRPLMLAASGDDPLSFPAAQALQQAARGEVLFQPFESAGRGLEMLARRPDLGDLIIAWLKRQLS